MKQWSKADYDQHKMHLRNIFPDAWQASAVITLVNVIEDQQNELIELRKAFELHTAKKKH